MPLVPDTGHPRVPPSCLSSLRHVFSTGLPRAFPCYPKTNGPQPVFSGLLPRRLSGHSHLHSDVPQACAPTVSHLHSSSSLPAALFLLGPLSGDEQPHLGSLGGLLDPSLQLSAHIQPASCLLTLTFHIAPVHVLLKALPPFSSQLFCSSVPTRKAQTFWGDL